MFLYKPKVSFWLKKNLNEVVNAIVKASNLFHELKEKSILAYKRLHKII